MVYHIFYSRTFCSQNIRAYYMINHLIRCMYLQTDSQRIKSYPFQSFSLWFIVNFFLNFLKFQPRYSYKVYFYQKREHLNCGMKRCFEVYELLSFLKLLEVERKLKTWKMQAWVNVILTLDLRCRCSALSVALFLGPTGRWSFCGSTRRLIA